MDLLNNTLRCVGDTHDRMSEDGLRLLRAARFAITKGFEPDEDLAAWLCTGVNWEGMVKSVSTERIREELTKMMKHSTVDTIEFLSHCCSSKAIRVLFDNTPIWLKPTSEKK